MRIPLPLAFLPAAMLSIACGCQGWPAGAVLGLRPHTLPDAQADRDTEATTFRQSHTAEAWCRTLVEAADDPVEALAPAGRLLERSDLPDADRAELLVAVSRHVPPTVVPGLVAALDSSQRPAGPRDLVRRAAIEACVVHAVLHRPLEGADEDRWREFASDGLRWPPTLIEWQRDPYRGLSDADPQVRRRFVEWLAAVRHPRALELAQQQLLDEHREVRDGALAALGLLGTAAARDVLEAEAHRTSGRARAIAVRALAGWGFDAIAPYADDPAWQVRQAVAEELARFETVSSAALLRNLVTARAPQVQAAAVASIASWPEDLAIPVLLEALRAGSADTRAAAFDALRSRREIDPSFPHAEPDAARRERAVAELVKRYDLPAELAFVRHERPVVTVTVGTDAHLLDAAVLALDDPDVLDRRRAARQLADLGRTRSLGGPMLVRLARHLAHEPDVEVWRFAFEAVLPDATPESVSIAVLAAAHHAADLRVLACRYALRHRRPEFTEWLVPLFDDAVRRVQLAAIEAAGHCGNPRALEDRSAAGGPGVRGLRSLLADANPQIRVAAAVAMCHLGAAEGGDELLRLSHSSDPAVRQMIVAAMGESGEPRFVARLAEMEHSETSEAVRRAVGNSLERLGAADARRTTDNGPRTPSNARLPTGDPLSPRESR